MKIDKKTEQEITFGVIAATLAMTVGVTLYSHSTRNHLTSKCPFAFIYGDKVIEHSINEVEKHTKHQNVRIIPDGYKYDPTTCLWYTVENGQTIATCGENYNFYTIYGNQAEYYGIDSHTINGVTVNDQIEEQVKSLYR